MTAPVAGAVTVTAVSATSVAVSVSAASSGTPPYSYQFQRALDTNGYPGAYENTGTASAALSTVDSGLTGGATYWYQCVVSDSAGGTATSVSQSVQLALPLGPSKLRGDFPAFSDPGQFPNAVITLWLNAGSQLVNASVFGTMTDLMIELFACHHMILDAQGMATANAGGIPGMASGVVASKSVDKVSISYDANMGSEGEQAGHWNLTTYGRRFFHFVQIFGAGPIQVGAGQDPQAYDPLNSQNAWPGPFYQGY